MSWVWVAGAAFVALLLVTGAALLVILAGGGLFLLRRRSASVPEATAVPAPEPPNVQPAASAPAEKPPRPKSLSGFPSVPPLGGAFLVPPQVPASLRSITPSNPPGPDKKTGGLLGFFDEPMAQPGDAAKTELFQRGKVPASWNDDAGDGVEATEIFSALSHDAGLEGFAEDESTTRGKTK